MALFGGFDLTGRDILVSARYFLRDSERTRYSDMELLAALNACLDTIYDLGGAIRMPSLETSSTMLAGGSLPTDCVSIVRVENASGTELLPVGDEPDDSAGYRVTAGRLETYASGERLTVRYVRCPSPLEDIDDEVPLPDVWRSALREMIPLVIRGKTSDLHDIAYAAVRSHNGGYASRMPDREIWR